MPCHLIACHITSYYIVSYRVVRFASSRGHRVPVGAQGNRHLSSFPTPQWDSRDAPLEGSRERGQV